ncbi:DNAJC8 [Lepeophtheirus salmonis]|uniref:DNAJC8 n=1 Tax=Lepeophtheirus salmonis TaxID=72036 RepID=A0A7R8CL87_LEPSM|nr:DNAJC8 [Lepeophtheirus salmonis]CAF2850883.1 DNAJC8 [Lepeophtheirus salmonis]
MSTQDEVNSDFSSFYKDLKETESADSTLTGKDQIARLLRPGATYRNLNPYEVLQVDPHTPIEELRKKYKRLTFLVHPDKNIDDKEKAQASFNAVKKAFKMLEEEDSRKQCEEIVKEAEAEDDPSYYKRTIKILIAKLFADHERKRQQLQEKKCNLEKEYAKNWEESRQGRVNSWQDFQTGKTKTKKKKEKARYTPMGFRPPKTKPESR